MELMDHQWGDYTWNDFNNSKASMLRLEDNIKIIIIYQFVKGMAIDF